MAESECARHPGINAIDMCVSCADPVCAECGYTTPDARVFCPGCSDEARRAAPPPPPVRHATRAELSRGGAMGMRLEPVSSSPSDSGKASPGMLAMVLSIIGFGCFPLGIWGFVMAIKELNRIRAGEAPEKGRVLCYIALTFNAFTALVFLLPFLGGRRH